LTDAKQLRDRLLKDTPYCSECGVGEFWEGKKLSLQIDHFDGDSDNNAPYNLRVLCPNCHSQTDNYGIKNKGSSSRRSKYLKEYKSNY
jgi:5-methylcytosine-specific restriction endonuclease McrA